MKDLTNYLTSIELKFDEKEFYVIVNREQHEKFQYHTGYCITLRNRSSWWDKELDSMIIHYSWRK